MNAPVFFDLWVIVPFLLLFMTSLFCLTSKFWSEGHRQNQFIIFIQALFGIVLSLLFVIFLYSNLNSEGVFIFSKTLIFDGLSYYASLLVIVLTMAVLFLSQGHPALKEQFSEHLFLVLNACIGMMVIIWSNDLIVAFIGIELMSLAFYILAGLSLEQKLSKEASFKYFVLGSVGSAIFLYGVALIYGAINSTSISDLAQISSLSTLEDPILLIGLSLLICGLFFKIALFPFHAWAPDVYQGSPTPVTAFMSTAGKLTPFVLFLRIVGTGVLISFTVFIDIMQWLAVLTMLVGNIMALRQESIKRVLAYSSIAHSGYIMLAVIALSLGSSQGMPVASVLFYFIAYGLMNIGAFAFVYLLEPTEHNMVTMDDLQGLSQKRPYIALALSICLLSLAGIPPTLGFFGKFYIFSTALNAGLVWGTIWAVISSVISLYYYLRPILYMYMMKPSERRVDEHQDVLVKYLLVTCAGLILFFGIFADLIIGQVAETMSLLFQ